jgi:hypothetical protein
MAFENGRRGTRSGVARLVGREGGTFARCGTTHGWRLPVRRSQSNTRFRAKHRDGVIR